MAEKGKLTIFFSYTAGAGKTGAMLRAARREKAQGRDVVIGWLAKTEDAAEDTGELSQGLERLEERCLSGKLSDYREFWLDGALRRHPELLVLGELAHRNMEGSRHLKRYQDVQELLRSGIDVYTTLNLTELESLNDVVREILGHEEKERIPDAVFDAADEVELVDVVPSELFHRRKTEATEAAAEETEAECREEAAELQRLRMLREMAFRKLAERMGSQTGKENGHVLICLSASPTNATVVRTAARMADAFQNGFTALYVEGRRESPEDARRLQENIRLAEDLGARVVTVYGEDVAVQIAEYARAAGVSKIVIGRTNDRRRLFETKKNMADRLIQMMPDKDFYIIPDNRPRYHSGKRLMAQREHPQLSAKDVGKTVLVLAAATVMGTLFFDANLGEANTIMVYILGVLLVSVWTSGRIYGAVASFLSVILFNFVFTEPRFTLRAYDARYPVTFLTMLAASFITSSLAMRLLAQAKIAAREAYRTGVLLETNQRLLQAESQEEVLKRTGDQIHKLLNRTAFLCPVREQAGVDFNVIYPAGEGRLFLTEEREREAAGWVAGNGKHAGSGTKTFPQADVLYMAVRGEKRVLAVAGIVMKGTPPLETFEKNLLVAILDGAALVLDKLELNREKQRAELMVEQESLRSNLLRSISHDLRTPLTSISGNAGILMENAAALSDGRKTQIYTNIYDDAMWLMELVENLLSVTRIENGTMGIRIEPELLEEVFDEALDHLDRKAKEHIIRRELPEDMLMAQMDARLIVQVLINILNNAVKYTPPGSEIVITAERRTEQVLVKIADNGPGIPDEAKAKIFDMFYTLGKAGGDGRRGLGLGLALCRSIIDAHGGSIGVRDNTPTGAVFYFTLQAAEVTMYEQTNDSDC